MLTQITWKNKNKNQNNHKYKDKESICFFSGLQAAIRRKLWKKELTVNKCNLLVPCKQNRKTHGIPDDFNHEFHSIASFCNLSATEECQIK